MYSHQIPTDDVQEPQPPSGNKPIAFTKQNQYELSWLEPRDFERLLYFLFDKEKENTSEYDEVVLMQGVGERGRDCVLRFKGENIGLIQCKRLQRNISEPDVAQEVLKFLLHVIKDENLISNSKTVFHYHFAVSSGFSENANDFIQQWNNRELHWEVIRDRCINVKSQRGNKALADIDVEVNKDRIKELVKKIHVEPQTPEKINQLLTKYTSIVPHFFEVKPVLDTETFEELLSQREKREIKLIGELNKAERILKELNPSYFDHLETTKEVVQKLLNRYSNNFRAYGKHLKKHTLELSSIISDALLTDGDLKNLNEKELYTLLSASFLHDIGLCVDEEEIEGLKERKEFLEYSKSYPGKSFEDFTRDYHSVLSYHFICDRWEELGILKEFVEPVSILASLQEEDEIARLKTEYSIGYSRDKIFLPYLATLVRIAEDLDIKNLTSWALLDIHRNAKNFSRSCQTWEETEVDFSFTIEDEEFVEFIGHIQDQLIHIAVKQKILKSQKTISECTKLLYNVPKSRFKLNVKFLRSNITGLHKEIGFSFDHHKVIELLSGKNIYSDSFVSIRELIQNAVDTCRLKKNGNDEFKPEIVFEIDHIGNLVVQDNGLGMDEYIVKSYFSKVGSSYHADFKTGAIGKFGVGVFTYFLIADSFEVETKADNSEGLKFLVEKDADTYFYFDEDPGQQKIGTKITLHLTSKIKEELSFKRLVSEIKKYAWLVEFPIIAKQGSHIEIIDAKNVGLIEEDCIRDRAKYYDLPPNGETLKLTLIKSKKGLKQGEVGVIVSEIDGAFDYPFFRPSKAQAQDLFSIHILNKGIWLQRIDLPSIEGAFGIVNFDAIEGIKLQRDGVSNIEALNAHLFLAEKDIVNQIFESWKELADEEKRKIIVGFVSGLVRSHFTFFRNYREKVLQEFKVLIYPTAGGILYKSFNSIDRVIKEYDKIIFIRANSVDHEDLYQITQIPLFFLATEWHEKRFYDFIFSDMGFRKMMVNCKLGSFQGFNFRDKSRTRTIQNIEAIPFNDKALFTISSSYGRGELVILNCDHPLIKYYTEKENELVGQPEVLSCFREIFNTIRMTNPGRAIQDLEFIDKELEKINSEMGDASFKVTEKDLPIWMNVR